MLEILATITGKESKIILHMNNLSIMILSWKKVHNFNVSLCKRNSENNFIEQITVITGKVMNAVCLSLKC